MKTRNDFPTYKDYLIYTKRMHYQWYEENNRTDDTRLSYSKLSEKYDVSEHHIYETMKKIRKEMRRVVN